MRGRRSSLTACHLTGVFVRGATGRIRRRERPECDVGGVALQQIRLRVEMVKKVSSAVDDEWAPGGGGFSDRHLLEGPGGDGKPVGPQKCYL